MNRSVAACVGRPSTATAIWLHIAVAIENRCRGWGPLDARAGLHKESDCEVLRAMADDTDAEEACYLSNLSAAAATVSVV